MMARVSTGGTRNEVSRPAAASLCGSMLAMPLLELYMSKPSRAFPPFPLWRLLLAAAVLVAAPARLLAGPPVVGQSAPQLVVPQLDGHEFDLAKLRGKVVLVNVWATWCSPCRSEMPTLNALYRRYHSRGLDLLGLSIDEAPDTAQVRQVMRQFSYPAALANAARVNGFGQPIAVPVTYVIDAQGVIRAQLQAEGPSGVSSQALEQAVLPLLPGRQGVLHGSGTGAGRSQR